MCVFDCHDLTAESTEKYSPSDRRFWLLTIIAGFFGPNDYPLLEDKLAKLYRIAFMRQQARHLGIENRTHDESHVIPINLNNFTYNRRRKRRGATGNLTEHRVLRKRRRRFYAKRNANWDTQNLTNSTENDDSNEMGVLGDGSDERTIAPPPTITTTPPVTNTTGKSGKFVQKNHDPNKVEILIHNVTYITDDELRKIAEKELDSNVLRYKTHSLYFILNRSTSIQPINYFYKQFAKNKKKTKAKR